MDITSEQLVYDHWVGDGFLASYPRSGSTLARLVLHHKFGLKTASTYDERHLSDKFQQAVGHIVASDIDDAGPLLLWKWHGVPQKELTCRCVVVHRDARDVFRSLKRFYWEVNHLKFSMTDLILGRHPWGDWSQWIKTWMNKAPSDTLWISFDELVNRQYGRLQDWAGLRMASKDVPDLNELRPADDRLFKDGESNDSEGMTDDEIRLFWSRHGSVMSMLGYRG